ncbi:MAG TPA: FtsX-like permease family protein [Cyclobacteriaceae bacterium]|nr:FtsX-like permease family protein [Cyclobacteriaceae bacterium]
MLRRKAYAIINIFGLAIGLSVCLVIWKYLDFETSFEKFNIKADRLYRIVSSLYTDGAKEQWGGNDLGPSLQAQLPEIKHFARTHGNNALVSNPAATGSRKSFREKNMIIADPVFLEMFSFKVLKGNAVKPLQDPYSIVLTSSIAKKYFGKEDPIGKKLNLAEGNIPGEYIVTAVIEDVPANTHFKFDFILPIHHLLQINFFKNGNNNRWDNFFTYVERYERSDIRSLESKIPAFIKTYRGNDKAINAAASLEFQPLLDIHYSPDLNRPGSQLNTVYFFELIAVFILAIAWINYINLSTARATERAREVGIKKAIGVSRKQLIVQFILESFLINLLGVALAIVLAVILLPTINEIISGNLVLDFAEPQLWIVATALFFMGSLASGAYPAFIMSSFKTTEMIKGKFARRGNFSLRNGLVVFQFAASLLLLVGTFVVYRQVKFMQAEGTGLDTHQMLIVKGPEVVARQGLEKKISAFKNNLLQQSFVSNVSASFSVPGTGAYWSMRMQRLGASPEEGQVGEITWVDVDFIKTYSIRMIAGKSWTPGVKSEEKFVIVNEEAVKVFGLGTNEGALHQRILFNHDTLGVLGVIKNHHWNSVKKPYSPLLLGVEDIPSQTISIRLNGNIHEAIQQIEHEYRRFFPSDQFSYYFLDDFFNAQYKSEEQFTKLFSLFSIFAILIACLGLWGLASFTTIHRLKEISIRKVLGASVRSICFLLSKQFLKPLMIGCVVAVPVGWYASNLWLTDFPYRMELTADLFALPIALLIAIALATVSIQTIKASLTDPVKNIKSE